MALTLLITPQERLLSEQARLLARRFERANDDFIAAVERSPRTEWEAGSASTAWSAPLTALHIAQSHSSLAEFLVAVARGAALPLLTSGCVNAPAGGRGAASSLPNKKLVVELLRRNGASAADLIRSLSDAELHRTTSSFGTSLSVAQLVDELLIGHFEEHRGSIRPAA